MVGTVRCATVSKEVVPHADRVVTFGADKECRRCGQDLDGEDHYLGDTDEPVPHIGWECEDCDFVIAELMDDD
jgi:hypothetical protein